MTDKPDLKVVKLDQPGLQNVAAMMRRVADDIDNGDYSSWQEAVLILNYGDGFSVFGWGIDHPSTACLLCAAGVQRFTDKLVDKCRD